MMDNLLFDVIIVGGGPAGCATALSLSKSNEKASFLVLDDSDPSSFKIGESLPPESSRLLHYLKPSLARSVVADGVTSGAHLSCTGNASAWASPVLEERHAIFNPFGHGLHLDRAAFDELLRNSVVGCQDDTNSSQGAPKRVVHGKFKNLEKNSAQNWALCCDVDGKDVTFFAKWVIDATGRKAFVATKLGAKIVTSEPLLAFYAVFNAPLLPVDDPDADSDRRTIIEATPDGWFYSALLPPKDSSSTRVVVFHTLPSHPSAKYTRRRDGFLDNLYASSTHIASIVKGKDYQMAVGGFPRCTAAGSSFLDRPCDIRSRWIAVGDAAMAFDPLSSQGMMTALEMACQIGLVIAKLLGGEDAGPGIEESYREVREEYERRRAYYYGIVKRFDGSEFWTQVVCGKATV